MSFFFSSWIVDGKNHQKGQIQTDAIGKEKNKQFEIPPFQKTFVSAFMIHVQVKDQRFHPLSYVLFDLLGLNWG